MTAQQVMGAINRLQSKLVRQEQALAITKAELAMYEEKLAELTGKKK